MWAVNDPGAAATLGLGQHRRVYLLTILDRETVLYSVRNILRIDCISPSTPIDHLTILGGVIKLDI